MKDKNLLDEKEQAERELEVAQEQLANKQQEINHLQIELAGYKAVAQCLKKEIKKTKKQAFVNTLCSIVLCVFLSLLIGYLQQEKK
jgi:chromosome segregation ATPase